jgi:uncharacterized protein with PQ loop repeat
VCWSFHGELFSKVCGLNSRVKVVYVFQTPTPLSVIVFLLWIRISTQRSQIIYPLRPCTGIQCVKAAYSVISHPWWWRLRLSLKGCFALNQLVPVTYACRNTYEQLLVYCWTENFVWVEFSIQFQVPWKCFMFATPSSFPVCKWNGVSFSWDIPVVLYRIIKYIGQKHNLFNVFIIKLMTIA